MNETTKETNRLNCTSSVSSFETLLQILDKEGRFQWNNQCVFLSKKHHDAYYPIRLEVKYSHTRIRIAAFTFEQAAEGATHLLQLSHGENSSDETMNLVRHQDWTKNNLLSDDDNDEDAWCAAFTTNQLETILTTHPYRTVGFHGFAFSVEQSIVVAQHAVCLALHRCSFVDGGHAFLHAFQNNNNNSNKSLRALSLHQLPWEYTVWKQLLPLLCVEELNLERITVDPDDCIAMSKIPIQLSLQRCHFTDQAQGLCQALAQTGGPQTLVLEDHAHEQARPCWSNLLQCAVQDCSNMKTLGIHFPSTWNATNHLRLVVNQLQRRNTLEGIILKNARHLQLWSEMMDTISQQTSLKKLHIIDCPKEHTDSMVGHLLHVLTRNRQLQVQLQGKGAYWRRVQQEQIEPQLSYNRLHCFAQQCQRTQDQHHRMNLLSSALDKTTRQKDPARTQLLLSSNLDSFIAHMHC